jgi:hypothetical protein
MLQSSKLLFSTQKTYTQLHNKMLQNSKAFCLALKSLHPIIGNASKLQIQASNFFKMRQDPEEKKKKKKDTIKTQNTVLIIMKKSSDKKKKKINKMQQKSNNIKNSKQKECEVNFIANYFAFLKIVELGFLSS